MLNIFCSLHVSERYFDGNKNDVFFFSISSLVPEIFKILFKNWCLKSFQHKDIYHKILKNYLGKYSIGALLKLGTSNVRQVRHKMAPAVLLPRHQFFFRVYFTLDWDSQFLSESDTVCSHGLQVRRHKAIWAFLVFQVGLSASLYLVKNGDILFITDRDWGRQ